jgi:hypothetical protein
METGMEVTNATSIFLGREAERVAARVELSDVQGSWGGRRIQANGSGQVIVRQVQAGLHERRYEFGLGHGEWKRLLDVLVEQDFLSMQPEERAGIPDEAYPTITLTNARGEQCMVSKWPGVIDERFAAVYAAMLRLETLTGQLDPVYSGPYRGGPEKSQAGGSLPGD